MTPGELHFETLKARQYGTEEEPTLCKEDWCHQPASHRCTWDGGVSWLYLCPIHAKKVEEAEETADASKGAP